MNSTRLYDSSSICTWIHEMFAWDIPEESKPSDPFLKELYNRLFDPDSKNPIVFGSAVEMTDEQAKKVFGNEFKAFRIFRFRSEK